MQKALDLRNQLLVPTDAEMHMSVSERDVFLISFFPLVLKDLFTRVAPELMGGAGPVMTAAELVASLVDPHNPRHA